MLFASWDAEEFALTSSTEWGEQHEAWLRERRGRLPERRQRRVGIAVRRRGGAVADAGDRRGRARRCAIRGHGLGRRRRARRERRRPRCLVPGTAGEVVDDRLGGGSDYTVFLNHLGVPSADLAFDGPYEVYHSVYDTHQYVTQFADPEFRYTTTLVKVLGIVALRLMEGDAIPLDVQATASAIAGYVGEVEGQRGAVAGGLAGVREALRELEQAAAAFSARRDTAVEAGDAARLAVLNRQAMSMERAFTDPDGLRERPWYRHLLHAPDRTYAPLVLPGIAEALASGDARRVADEAARVAQALRRAAATLR